MTRPETLNTSSDIRAARVALDLCATDEQFAAWARRYGSAAIEGCLEASDSGESYDLFEGDD